MTAGDLNGYPNPEELAAAARRAAHEPVRLLAALAVLEPGACLRSLASAGVGNLPREALTAVLTTALRQLGRTATVSDLEALAAAAAAHGDAVPIDELARTVLALPGEQVPASLAAVLGTLLERHCDHPALLRATVALAMRDREPVRAHALLTRLGLAEPTPATTAFVRTARRQLPEAEGQRTRVALLSSFTVDQLVPFVDLQCRDLGLVPEIYVAPFNSWMREVVDEGARLRSFEPHIVFLSVAIDDLVSELAGAPTPKELAAAGDQALERVVGAAEQFRLWSVEPLVVHGFHSAFRDPAGVLAGCEGPSRAQWLAELNGRLSERLTTLRGCYFLDLVDLFVRVDAGADTPKMRHLAGVRLPASAVPEVARAYARYIA